MESNIITNIEFFDELKPWDKFYVITGGKIKAYRFACKHPYIKERIIVVNDHSYTETCSLFIDLEDKDKVFLSNYNSYEVGEIMINQLEDRIESIKEVYIEES